MKTYPCCYCNQKFPRNKLADHIDKEHDDEIPDDMTAYRLAYDIINDKPDHCGRCCVCHGPTQWSEKTQKYLRTCSQKCKDKLREQYKKNMLRVYNKTTLLNDPEHQKKMLANRKISGTYTWSDGTKFSYCGSYEKKLLEFLDDAMQYDSKDVMTPGPTFEYQYQGKKHYWITDVYIISLGLCIDCKDGGDNKNGREMPEYREKQIAKETMITSQGTYSYLRLTNNNFAQLLGIMAEMKKNIIDNVNGPIFRIHESYQDITQTEVEDELSLMESIGLGIMHHMQNTYLPVRITNIGHMVNSGIYEMFDMTPISRNTGGKVLYLKSIKETMDYINESYPGLEVECTLHNKYDDMGGVTFSLVTSDI